MKTMGFLISTKENEKRRALLPEHLVSIKNKESLYFESGYGDLLGHCDEEYIAKGVNVVSKEEAMNQDIICDPKIGDADYLELLHPGQTVFGWIHAVQNKDITDKLIQRRLTAIAWEDMFKKERHVFWRNNELAGEAAVLHAFTLYGKVPYECKVAVIGRGNTARGAFKTLCSLGADVTVYDRKTEKLFREELTNYDVVVNCVLWDVYRKDHIIYREDLARLRRPSLIIDVSCDRAGAIETSIPTTIADPVYSVDGVLHYVVDHTPALISYSATRALGNELVGYVDALLEDKLNNHEELKKAVIIENGIILDQRIIDYQNR